MPDPGHPAPALAAPASLPSVLVRDGLALVGYGAAVVVVVGSFGPWAQVSQFTASGMEGDGVVTFVAAVIAAVGIGVASTARPRTVLGSDWVAAAAATVAMFIAAYDAIEIPRTFRLLGDDVGTRTAGWGIWATLIGSVVLTGVAVAIVMRARWRHAR